MTLADRLETTTENDPYFSYCLWPYRPVAPSAGKLRQVNLLFQTFDLMNADERMFELVGLIRQAVGLGHTVWGAKFSGGTLSWEYYFYDYRRLARVRSIPLVLDAIRPLVRCELPPGEQVPYFMFSLDVGDELVAGARGLDEIHVYIGNVGSAVSSGISYSFTGAGRRLENFYFFFDPRKHLADIRHKVASSVFLEIERVGPDEVIWRELLDCNTVCVANKQRNDCIYFAGVRVDALLWFLERMRYPDSIVAFVCEHRDRLDHLLYDVGIDYRMEDGKIVVLKSAYYGTF
jgi:hypothetical protein